MAVRQTLTWTTLDYSPGSHAVFTWSASRNPRFLCNTLHQAEYSFFCTPLRCQNALEAIIRDSIVIKSSLWMNKLLKCRFHSFRPAAFSYHSFGCYATLITICVNNVRDPAGSTICVYHAFTCLLTLICANDMKIFKRFMPSEESAWDWK